MFESTKSPVFLPDIGFDNQGKPYSDKTTQQYAANPLLAYHQLLRDFTGGVRVAEKNCSVYYQQLEFANKDSASAGIAPGSMHWEAFDLDGLVQALENQQSVLPFLKTLHIWSELSQAEQARLEQTLENLGETDKQTVLLNIKKHTVHALLARAIYSPEQLQYGLTKAQYKDLEQKIDDFVMIWRQGTVGCHGSSRISEKVMSLNSTGSDYQSTNICFNQSSQTLQVVATASISFPDPIEGTRIPIPGQITATVAPHRDGKALRAQVCNVQATNSILLDFYHDTLHVNGEHISGETLNISDDMGCAVIKSAINQYQQKQQQQEQFYQALAQDDSTQLANLITQGMDVEQPLGAQAKTPLQLAAKANKPRIVASLLEHGADMYRPMPSASGELTPSVRMRAKQGEYEAETQGVINRHHKISNMVSTLSLVTMAMTAAAILPITAVLVCGYYASGHSDIKKTVTETADSIGRKVASNVVKALSSFSLFVAPVPSHSPAELNKQTSSSDDIPVVNAPSC